MVRLFVAEGDDQHPLTQKRLPELGTEPLLLRSPWRSCIMAAVSTAIVASTGRARPGTYLKSVAWFSVADLSVTACQLYTRQELNKAAFKKDNVQPTPAKLWERTEWWTLEDSVLCGGALGLACALNPRNFAMVSGWKRYVGITTVGCAIGVRSLQIGAALGVPVQEDTLIERLFAEHKKQHYRRLHQDEMAKASLSRPAKALLSYYTSDSTLAWLTGLPSLSTPSGRVTRGRPTSSNMGQRYAAGSAAVQQQSEQMQLAIGFDKKELTGPGYSDTGLRTYLEDPTTENQDDLQEQLKYMENLTSAAVAEVAYLRKEMVKKEHELHQTPEDAAGKDLLRRQLQFLNSFTLGLSMRVTVFESRKAETRRRLGQMQQDEPASSTQATQANLAADRKTTYSPEASIERIRRTLMTKKHEQAQLKQTLSAFEAERPPPGTSLRTIQAARDTLSRARDMEADNDKNIEAVGQLLRELEEQVHRAETNKTR